MTSARREAPRDPLHHRLLAVALRAVIRLFGALPEVVAYGVADLFAVPIWCAWSLRDRRGRTRRGYWRNVRIVYRPGGLGQQRPRGHLWRVCRHLTWLFVDSCRLHHITHDNVADRLDLTEFPPIPELHQQGRGVIFATGHIGVWEIAGHAAGLRGLPITSVFRPSPIPGIDRLLTELRSRTGQKLVAKKNVLPTLQQALGAGETVGILCDSAGRHGDVFPPFLGTPAATVATPALLHLRTGAPIVVATAMRTGRFRFRLRVWDVIEQVPEQDRRLAVAAILTRINRALSRAVAEYPEQWFWQGRRFKHRPPGERPGADGLPPPAATPRPDRVAPREKTAPG